MQLKYTENYEEMTKYQSKIDGLTNVCSDYFYVPVEEGIGGLRYVIDSDGHALYLIKKSGLPEEIRESLVGGDAGAGGYGDYQSLNDVYGVTSNLKVYYCSGGVDSIRGLAKENLDNDNPNRVVFENGTGMSELLQDYDTDGDGKISAQETKSVTKFTVTENSEITSLKDLFNLANLKELTLDNINLSNLSGLENCANLYYLCFKNYGKGNDIEDYASIKKLSNLQYLYLENSKDKQVKDIFTSMQNVDFTKLQYLGVYGSGTKVTDISIISSLSSTTKSSVAYMYFYGNDLSSIESFSDFVNVVETRIQSNSKLTTLGGLKNMQKLISVYASNCNLGLNEIYQDDLENDGRNPETDSCLQGKAYLSHLDFSNNKNLKWVNYIDSLIKSLDYISFWNCEEIIGNSIKDITDIILSAGNRSIPQKYQIYLSTNERLDYLDFGLQDSSEEFLALKDSLELKALRLDRKF